MEPFRGAGYTGHWENEALMVADTSQVWPGFLIALIVVLALAGIVMVAGKLTNR